MGYLQSTDQGSIHEAINLGSAHKSERSAGLSAVGRAAQRASIRPADQLDRVTLSPAADALAQVNGEQGPASIERLNVLREAIKANTLPIFPGAIAEAILAEEGQSEPGALGADDGAMLAE